MACCSAGGSIPPPRSETHRAVDGALAAPGLSVTQINITVSTILASYFPGGPTYLFTGCG